MLKPLLLLALCLGSAPLFAADEPAAAAPAPAVAPAPEAKHLLQGGDAAPEFKVTQWYKGGPVTLEADKTYIVECWATWCGPCVAAFPHLTELAKAYDGKITVIGVNVFERKKPEEVKAFVEGQGEKMGYNVAADGENVIAKQWLQAAGKNGIPCAFVVSKGKLIWIGHPSKLNPTLLDAILAGTFDAVAAAKADEAAEAPGRFFMKNVMPLARKKDYAGAITQLEEMKKQFPGQEKTIDIHISRMKAAEAKAAADAEATKAKTEAEVKTEK